MSAITWLPVYPGMTQDELVLIREALLYLGQRTGYPTEYIAIEKLWRRLGESVSIRE